MARVRCELPNASGLIDGVRFERAADGAMVSEEMGDAAAERLAGIPGFRALLGEKKEAPPPKAPVPGDLDGDGKRDRPARKAAAKPAE